MQIRLRYWTRFLRAFLARFKHILFVGVVFGLLLFALLTFLFSRVFSTNVEYVGVTGRYHTEELPTFVQNMIGEGLTQMNESGVAVAALAERWETNENGTVWTFYLRRDKKWHDGSPVDADSVQYSFEDAEVERVDPYTIRFTLSSAFSPFPAVVARPTFKKGLLGTGAWRVMNLKLNASFVEELVLRNAAGDKRVLRFYPSEDGTKTAFQLGQIDTILDVLEPAPFDSWTNTKITETPKKNRIVAIFFKMDSPLFKPENTEAATATTKALRQALSYAIDKDAFGGTRALGPTPPNSWAYNPLVKDYNYDVPRAHELLKDFQAETTVNLTTTSTLLPVAEKVAEYWKEIGINTNVQVVPAIPENYEAFLAIYDMPQDPDQYSIWHSAQLTTNISKYSNPRIDTLLEAGRVELDPEERKRIYLDFQRFLLEDAPAVFLYHPISYTVSRL